MGYLWARTGKEKCSKLIFFYVNPTEKEFIYLYGLPLFIYERVNASILIELQVLLATKLARSGDQFQTGKKESQLGPAAVSSC